MPEEKEKSDKSRYRNKWIAENLDRMNLTLPKGKKKEIADHAAARGESPTKFILRAIETQLAIDNSVDHE